MKNALKHRNPPPPTIRIIECPACKRDRLKKYENDDGTISPAKTETVNVRGDDRYLEVCAYCTERYRKADGQFVKENLKKLSKAFGDGNDSDGDGDGDGGDKATDHKDFSLN